MALVQPTNLFPSSFRGSGGDVIDASQDNTFSLQLNGSSACVAYSMVIMQNDASSTVVYSVAKQSLSTPIYPRNYLNEPQRLNISVPSTSGIVNGYANGYKWNVTLWWDNSNSITSQDTFFLAQATPYFSVTNNPFTLTSKQLSLNATYSQADSIPLEWYRWVLLDGNGNTVADSGEIYSEDIQLNVDGLLDGETFTYVITGQTQSGVPVAGTIDAEWGRLYDIDGEPLFDINNEPLYDSTQGETHYTNEGEFIVDYEAPVVNGAIAAKCDPKTGDIVLSFTGISIIQGNGSGSLEYINNTPITNDISLQMAVGSRVIFNHVNSAAMALPANVTHIWSGRPDAVTATLYSFTEQTGEGNTISAELSVKKGVIVYRYNNLTILSDYVTNSFASKWIIAIMRGRNVTVQVWDYANLYPSDTLYPSETLYPGVGAEWKKYGLYSNIVRSMVIGSSIIGTMTMTGSNLVFNISQAGSYSFIFTDDKDRQPIRDGISGDYTAGDSFSIPTPSENVYIIFCSAYDSDGRYLGTASFYMNQDATVPQEPDSASLLTSITLNGPQSVDYIKVVSGKLSDSQTSTYLDISYSDHDKTFDVGTILFAKFERTLESGNYATGGETITGWEVYKQKTGVTSLQFVASLSLSQTSLTDALVENGQGYTYYIFPTGLETMGNPVVSNEIISKVWNYVLFTATESQSNKNVLYVNAAYVFQGNVETGTVSNNAASNVLNNFTQYPKILKGTQNFKSGKLSALVGYVDTQGNAYTETRTLRDALFALSTSQERMFLKTRAGDLLEVSVHSAVSMEVNDASSYQPHTATIEWAEISSVKGVSLVYEG